MQVLNNLQQKNMYKEPILISINTSFFMHHSINGVTKINFKVIC